MAYWEGAKPVTYGGVRFRSTLEAKWATVFDAFGIAWEYEPLRVRDSAGSYLPDFRLCNSDLYCEVKPALSHAELAPHAARWERFVLDNQLGALVILIGFPRVEWYQEWTGCCGLIGKEWIDLSQLALMGPGYSSPEPLREVMDRERFVGAVKAAINFSPGAI